MRNMKVLMVNGSAHQKGNTFLSLEEVGKALKEEGIDYEIFQLGGGPIRDCIGCGQCSEKGCVFADVMNKYFGISQMPVAGSTYWNLVHGCTPGEAAMDEEGLQTMRNLGRNMAWMLKCLEAGKEQGISLPKTERGNQTNFIR